MSEIKELPILFSAPMVRAILEGRKTQTRRVMNTQPPFVSADEAYATAAYRGKCPYGQPGDRLWVKETAIIAPKHWNDGTDCNTYGEEGLPRMVQYLATNPNRDAANDYKLKVRPSIFMWRWASRITLEITDIRVQRLQEISEEDARSEGCEGMPFSLTIDNRKLNAAKGERSYRAGFCGLWDSINFKHCPWDDNPWVWALSFKRVGA